MDHTVEIVVEAIEELHHILSAARAGKVLLLILWNSLRLLDKGLLCLSIAGWNRRVLPGLGGRAPDDTTNTAVLDSPIET